MTINHMVKSDAAMNRDDANTLDLKQYVPAGLSLIGGLFISYLAFQEVQKHELLRAEEQFRLGSIERIEAVERRFSAERAIMKSIVAFYQGSTNVDRGEFRSFMQTVTSGKQGFQAFEWIPRVPRSDRATYEQLARTEGYDDFQFKEKAPGGSMVRAAKRDEYYPVYYVEPYAGNEAALGFDLASSSTRLATLEEATTSGRIIASGRINLVQLKENNAGFLLFAPIYRKGQLTATVDQRRQSLQGFALGVIRISSLISGFSEGKVSKNLKRAAGIDLYAYDLGAENVGELLYIHHSRARQNKATALTLDEARSGVLLERSVDVGGRKWVLIAKPVDPYFNAQVSGWKWVILLLGMLTTATLMAYMVQSARRTRIVERLVNERTAELNDRESFIAAIVDTVVDGIISIDAKGRVETINPAAASTFGYQAADVIGQNVKMLMPEPYHGKHDGYLGAYLETGDAKVIGIGREVTGKRKDGSVFPMDLAISEMSFGGRRMFTGIVRDITERKQAEKLKQEFVSTVSHELRTPLTSIMGSLGLIKSGTIGEVPDKFMSMLDIAYNNSDRLVRLINEILDIEKIESGKMDFQKVSLDLDTLLQKAIEANAGYAEAHGVRFVRTGEEVHNALVLGDHDRLTQVLTNLLSNAAKFSPPEGSVEISLIPREDGFRVTVSDQGEGIPEEFSDKIFSKFSQADSSDTRSRGGTGLGLSITRSIVEQHGGTIGFETEAGKGTSFYFDLPKWQKEERIAPLESLYSSENRILICEDDPDIARLLEMMLSEDGFESDIAATANEAETLLSQRNYDAMILDLGLPGKDGITLLRELRDNPETRDLPVIVVSATAKKGKKQMNGSALGVVDWMEKPIDRERLFDNLKSALSSSSNGKSRILHIEDDQDILDVVNSVVGDYAEMKTAKTLAQAKLILKAEEFDLVILDLGLPDGPGEEVLPLLKTKAGKSTPVIVFSAREISADQIQNFSVTLTKSRTTNEMLLETILSIIDSRQSSRTL